LPKAITLPENVIAPTKLPMKSSKRLPPGKGSCSPKAAGLLTTATAMSTAAMPTSECIAATSCGICVICTRLATKAPIIPPITAAMRMKATFLVMASVTSTAIAMPIMPKRLPRRAATGEERPFSARMKSTLATRYQSASWLALMPFPSPPSAPSS